MFGKALLDLADIANCTSNDFHCMHFNFHGQEFDNMHKKVLKKYYEEAADDYDTWSEAALMFDDAPEAPNGNESATRVNWTSHTGLIERQESIDIINYMLDVYCKALVVIFDALGQKTDCPLAVGVQNTVQTRIEYWSKEMAFFNARRK